MHTAPAPRIPRYDVTYGGYPKGIPVEQVRQMLALAEFNDVLQVNLEHFALAKKRFTDHRDEWTKLLQVGWLFSLLAKGVHL